MRLRLGYDMTIRRGTARSIATLACLIAAAPASAKTPGQTYCFNGVCHYVKTIAETRRDIGRTQVLHTSSYDDAKRDRFNPSNLTSSGEYFRSWAPDNAASPNYPNGTKLLVWHPSNKKTLVVRINNAGPYWRDRRLDLSRAAADHLGFKGTARLHVRVLAAPTKREATYSRGRSYAPVQGYVGRYPSIDLAYKALGHVAAAPKATASVAARPAKSTRGDTPIRNGKRR